MEERNPEVARAAGICLRCGQPYHACQCEVDAIEPKEAHDRVQWFRKKAEASADRLFQLGHWVTSGDAHKDHETAVDDHFQLLSYGGLRGLKGRILTLADIKLSFDLLGGDLVAVDRENSPVIRIRSTRNFGATGGQRKKHGE